jgi:hypothetical protein
MRAILAALLITLSLSVPAQTVGEVVTDVITSPTTFAVCKAVDVVSTIYLLSVGGFVEANPIVAWSMSVGGYVPLIAASIGLWYVIKEANNPYVTGFANVVTCAVAGSNLALIP